MHTGLGVALEGLGRHREADAAFARGFTGRDAPAAVRTRMLWVYGFAVSGRLPEKAAQAFDAVLREEPDHPQALYGRAMLLAEQGQPARATQLFSRALEVRPSFTD